MPTTVQEIGPTTLIAKLTDESAPPREFPLTERDGVVLLGRIYTRLLYSHPIEDPEDAVGVFAAECQVCSLRGDLHFKLFGMRV